MTDRTTATPRRTQVGNAGRILVTGVSIAAGLGLIGAFESASATATATVDTTPPPVAQVQVIRRVVVVPTAQPDIVLQATLAGTRTTPTTAPAPIIRVRPAPAATASAPAAGTSRAATPAAAAPAPVTKSGGS
jgi:hypothetical protein